MRPFELADDLIERGRLIPPYLVPIFLWACSLKSAGGQCPPFLRTSLISTPAHTYFLLSVLPWPCRRMTVVDVRLEWSTSCFTTKMAVCVCMYVCSLQTTCDFLRLILRTHQETIIILSFRFVGDLHGWHRVFLFCFSFALDYGSCPTTGLVSKCTISSRARKFSSRVTTWASRKCWSVSPSCVGTNWLVALCTTMVSLKSSVCVCDYHRHLAIGFQLLAAGSVSQGYY